ncbi:hypothetical protein Tsubulata_028119 [Turnera subulata]|uniref:Subtilisin-like protease SBT5.3 n=1 Tax=Turnera subulata TaxID=218843 RepID=A0A9Q0J4R2_9ROSI|nr:hypothetical protein Tsubulata_028119 [Turnera subulata]
MLLLFLTITLVHGATMDRKLYIVYMGEHSHPDSESVIKANHEMLTTVTGSFDAAQEVAIHHYTKSFRGFSAKLTQVQAQQLAESHSVVSVFESRMNKLHTTHSWDFLGLNSHYQSHRPSMVSRAANVIVGVVDTGVWPESKSFNDEGLGPVPTKFKGSCVPGQNFTLANCNRKLIGARFYSKGLEAELGPFEGLGLTFFRSARDSDGHGTHTASTIAGSVVPDVSLHGMARGTARGGAPNARLAIYKACWFNLCSDSDILSAMDDAIHDGVDVLSLSLASDPPEPIYFENAVAIGAFHAFRKGVLVSCSAGNSFLPGTVSNVAPWILTAAASSIDREFNSNIYLGNSEIVKGLSLNPLNMDRSHGLIAGRNAAAPGVPAQNASFCKKNTLDSTKINGNIVVCALKTIRDSRTTKATEVQKAGGVGVIFIDPFARTVGFQYTIPSTSIGQEEAQQLEAYMQTQKYPVARIVPTVTSLHTKPAPKVSVFSSQGPNTITPDIIKPDITAPGVNILAAWSPLATDDSGGRSVDFNIVSGTSMSCPHVSAVAAILKSYHPSWSPAAIKSAIMTTATVMDNTHRRIDRDPNGTRATPFDFGSGHINPIAALNPGLVYDFDSTDVIKFLCGTGVSRMRGNVSVHRTVTYYGKGPATFVASVDCPAGVKLYIVYLGEHSHPDQESVIKANHEMLTTVTGSYDAAQEVALHHYTKTFRGFSAMLTQEQAQQLADSHSVVSVFKSATHKLHTTHSWEFLGLNSLYQSHQPSVASWESNVIVGVIDSGVWPESKSFNDEGLGPVPEKFKGSCVPGQNFTSAKCNRKLIGARFYSKGFEAENGPLEGFGRTFFRSARDSDGHGTHTSSTIAGSVVPDVSLYGIARGTARGGAPNARLAIYKACWFNLCSDADILSAMDDAIDDGVDVLSLSLGPNPPEPIYFENANSIGAFHAFRKGVLVSCSAGNSFFPGTASNVAPWILTVAASTIDREFNSNIYLGNSNILKGFSLNPLKMDTSYGLIAGEDAAVPGVTTQNASFCKNNTLDSNKIKGKIVVCALESPLDNRRQKAPVVQQGGGVGMILIDPFALSVGFQFAIPATLIGQEEAQQLQEYMQTQKYPVARIVPTVTSLHTKPAPKVAVFSSQGPNIITPDIIKPDITAPGVNILAAWSPLATDDSGGRSVDFNIVSGTSMSCPHVSAVAAILKSYNPSWSPAAIMSAIMTTATVMDNTYRWIGRDPNATQATPFDFGSGHINPISALNPGLLYDFDSTDVISFLCSTGASPAQLKNLTGQPTYCQKPYTQSYDFNYPSIGVSRMHGKVSVHRTVTYCGKGPATFVAAVDYPVGVQVSVTPAALKFNRAGEKTTFRVDFTPLETSNGNFVFGALTWKNDVHKIRSPIALSVLSL